MSSLFEEFLLDQEVIEDLREDINIPMNALIMTDDGKIKNRTYGELRPSKATMKALCKMYGFSRSHIKVLEDEGLGDLVAEQFNHFLSKDRKVNKLRLIEDTVQGIVDKNYKKFDNLDLFRQAHDFFEDKGFSFTTDIISNSDEYTRIRFMIDDLSKNVGMAEENGSDNDILKAGFEISNSEIGLRNMGINSLIYRQICTNGMMQEIGGTDNQEIFYNRGKDFNIAAKRPMLNNALIRTLSKSKETLDVFGKTKDMKVDEPKYEFKRIGKQYNLGQVHVEGFSETFNKEPQRNMFGVINAVTRYGRDLGKKSYTDRSKFEFIASDVMSKLDKR